jgi:hypothetical protein
MAFEVDLAIDQGTFFQQMWTVFTEPTQTVLANLSGYTGAMNVCISYDNSQTVASYSTGNNMTINVASSTVTVNIANTDFNGIKFPSNEDADSVDLVYDVKLTDASLKSVRIAQGTLTVNRAVTK